MNKEAELQNGASKEFVRSHSYPVAPLPELIEFVLKVYTDLGYTQYHDKELIAKIHGLAYPTIKQRLSTAQQYNLLEIKHGTGYKVTQNFIRIYRPISEREGEEAILETLKTPLIYNKLIEEYNGHILPQKTGLSTILFRQFNINERVSDRAAEVFLENLKIYGLLGEDNVLRFQLKTQPINTKLDDVFEVRESSLNQMTEKEIKSLPLSTSFKAEIIEENFMEIPIPLKIGRAVLKLPENASPEDYKKIAKVIEAYGE